MMKSGRAEHTVNVWKPARPIDALLEGAVHGRAAMNMRLRIRSVPWQPGHLPERSGEQYAADKEEDP